MAVSNKLAEAYVEFTGRMRPLSDHMRKAHAAVDGFVKRAQRRLDAFAAHAERIGKRATLYLTTPIVGLGAAMARAAMQAEESENLFVVSMGNMGKAARQWSIEYSKALKLNDYGVRRNLATFNVMLNSMGLGEKAAYDMAKGLTQLAYDMASFYNLRPEEAFLKLRAGISGEAEPLKQLGILVNENTIKAAAYANGIAQVGAQLTETQKIQARYLVIMQQTTKAQGDLARTLDSPTNKLRALREQAEKLAIQFGALLLPSVSALIDTASELVTALKGMSDATAGLIGRFAGYAAAIGPVALGLAGIVKLMTWIKANSKLVLSVAVVGAGLEILREYVALQKAENRRRNPEQGAKEMVEQGKANVPGWIKARMDQGKGFGEAKADVEKLLTERVAEERKRAADLEQQIRTKEIKMGPERTALRDIGIGQGAAEYWLLKRQVAEAKRKAWVNERLLATTKKITAEQMKQSGKPGAGGPAGAPGMPGAGQLLGKFDAAGMRADLLRARGEIIKADIEELRNWYDARKKAVKEGSDEELLLTETYTAKLKAILKKRHDDMAEAVQKAEDEAERLKAAAGAALTGGLYGAGGLLGEGESLMPTAGAPLGGFGVAGPSALGNVGTMPGGRKEKAWRRQQKIADQTARRNQRKQIRNDWAEKISEFRKSRGGRMTGFDRDVLRGMIQQRDAALRGGLDRGQKKDLASKDKPFNELQGDSLLKILNSIEENTRNPKPGILGA